MIRLPLIIYIPVLFLMGIVYVASGTLFTKNKISHLKESAIRFLVLATIFTAIYYLT